LCPWAAAIRRADRPGALPTVVILNWLETLKEKVPR